MTKGQTTSKQPEVDKEDAEIRLDLENPVE